MANGNFGGGDGSPGNPYLVEDAQDFNAIRNNLSASYRQTKNIDMSEFTTWSVIGDGYYYSAINVDVDRPFSGNYDGGNFKIINFNITGNYRADVFHYDPSNTYASLFGWVDNCTLENISLYGSVIVEITDDSYLSGGLTGDVNESTIRNCHFYGDIVSGHYVGGLLSQIYDSIVENCSFTGTIDGHSNLGGVIGYSDNSVITRCCSNGVVTASEYYGGGLVGFSRNSYYENCYANTDVSSGDYVGGLIGGNSNDTYTNTYSAGTVKGNGAVGGLVGDNYRTNIVNNSLVLVSSIEGVGTDQWDFGRFLSYQNSDNTINNSFGLDATVFLNIEEGILIDDAPQLITQEMATDRAFYESLGWDFENVWNIKPNNYPTFRKSTIGQLEVILTDDIIVIF